MGYRPDRITTARTIMFHGELVCGRTMGAQREAVKKPKSKEWKQKVSVRMKQIWEHPQATSATPSYFEAILWGKQRGRVEE